MSSTAITSLIISNFIPVIGVLFFRWDASSIVFLYWFENVVVGVYNILKMVFAKGTLLASNKGPNVVSGIIRMTFIMFFCFHYGMFTIAQGFFVFALLIKDLLFARFLLLSMFALFVSHGISFITNYIGGKEYRRANLGLLMFAPYMRVIIVQIVVFSTAMIIVQTGDTIPSLLLLVILKSIADLFSHMFEHREDNVYVPAPWSSKFLTHIGNAMSPIFEIAY